jgi:putative transposase
LKVGLNTLDSKPRKIGSQSSIRSQSNLLTAFSSFPVVSALSKQALHRPIEGTIKTVTVSMTPSGKYYASVLTELEGDKPVACTDGKVAGIDLGLKDFAIVNDGIKTSKYPNLSI